MNAVRRAALVACCGLVLAGTGCARPGPRAAAPGTLSLAAAEFAPAVGRAALPRVDAFYAPGAQSATAWLPDGTLWNGDFELAFVDAAGALLAWRTPEPAGPHHALPAARREVRTPAGTIELRAFMPWRGDDRDSVGWTRLSLRVLPAAGATGGAPAAPGLAVRSGGGPGHPLHPDAPIGERFGYALGDGRIERDGRTIAVVSRGGGGTVAWDAAGGAADSLPAQERRAWRPRPSGRAQPGATFALDVWLAPVGGVPRGTRPPDHGLTFERSLARTAAAWEAEMARGAVLVHPDPRVQAALTAAHRLLVGTRERRAGTLFFLGSPMQYRDLYLRDGVRVVRALLLLGRPELAGSALATMFDFQWRTGAFLSQRGQLDGTGQALWGLAQFAALGGDAAQVEAALDPALRAARWIAMQRGASARRGGPAAGLLPYSDPRDNELVRGHLLGTDAWGLAGLEALSGVLRAHGRAAAADTVDAEAAGYRARLVTVWDRETARQGRPLPPVVEGGGRDWGNLAAAYPCRVFAADDPRVLALDRWLRARTYVAGLPTYGSRDSIHHYLGIDLAHAALARGDRRQFASDLAALVDHAQPDGSGFELAAVHGGFGDNLPPHGTFAAMFVDLVRSSVIEEAGDSLVLLAGLPAGPAIADPARPLRFERVPTRFGPASLTLTSRDAATYTLTATLPAPAIVDWPPPTRVVALRGPGAIAPAAGGRRFVLPAGTGSWTLEIVAGEGGTR